MPKKESIVKRSTVSAACGATTKFENRRSFTVFHVRYYKRLRDCDIRSSNLAIRSTCTRVVGLLSADKAGIRRVRCDVYAIIHHDGDEDAICDGSMHITYTLVISVPQIDVKPKTWGRTSDLSEKKNKKN